MTSPTTMASPTGPTTMTSHAIDEGAGRIISNAPPAHYMVKIQSFLSLTKHSVEKYESAVFQAGGYNWKMIIYPSGNKNKNGKDHVSLYLAMAETSSLPSGWEVRALIRFFLLDQDKDSFIIFQDAMRKETRFHGMRLEWGFDRLIPLNIFTDAQNGYLVDDTCVFGAEVFISMEKGTGKGENLMMLKDTLGQKYSWRIYTFSKLDKEFYDSSVFIAGNQKWKIRIYPRGHGTGVGSFVSLYLVLADVNTVPSGTRILAEFTLRMLDQYYGKNFWGKANHWFSASSQESGWAKFISSANFYNTSVGVLVNDLCIVDAEVTILGTVANAQF